MFGIHHLIDEFQGTVVARGTLATDSIRAYNSRTSNGRSIDCAVAIETIRRP